MSPLEIPYPQRSSGKVWHYTREAGMRGILTSNRIWASPASVLNDPSELDYGIQFVRDVWRDRRPRLERTDIGAVEFIDRVLGSGWEESIRSSTYIACASSAPDLLSQWRGYAGTDGYAIGFLINEGLWFGGPDVLASGHYRASLPYWFDVVYEPNEQRALVEAFLDYFAALPQALREPRELWMARLTFSPVPTLLKHPGYHEEKEVRWVGSDLTLELGTDTRSHLPIGSYGLNSGSASLASLPIVEVMVGPTSSAHAELDVDDFLRSIGRSVPVTRSTTPHR